MLLRFRLRCYLIDSRLNIPVDYFVLLFAALSSWSPWWPKLQFLDNDCISITSIVRCLHLILEWLWIVLTNCINRSLFILVNGHAALAQTGLLFSLLHLKLPKNKLVVLGNLEHRWLHILIVLRRMLLVLRNRHAATEALLLLGQLPLAQRKHIFEGLLALLLWLHVVLGAWLSVCRVSTRYGSRSSCLACIYRHLRSWSHVGNRRQMNWRFRFGTLALGMLLLQ